MNINKIQKYYKNKYVLITGHTGFKGSWLSLILNQLGAKVIGISKSTLQENSHYHFIKNIFYKEYFFDLTNRTKTFKLINTTKPDIIFNLAAQSLVIKSYEDPYQTFFDNYLITLNVVESLRHIKKKMNIIFITSDKSYKNVNTSRAYKENDILGGDDPYSGSKGAVEILINSYFHSYFNHKSNIRLAVARAGNVIGGGDWSNNRIIPDTFKSWYKNEKIGLRNPYSTRPWQHVLEPLFGYLILGYNLNYKKKISGEAYNFGPNSKHRSVLDLISNLNKLWNKDKILFNNKKSVKTKYREANLLALNSNKAKNQLDWSCNLTFKETLKLIYEWYFEFYYNKENIINISKKQIFYFIDKLKNEN